MDSFMADVTDIDANIGDEVIIFDNENITLEEYAKASNGITYEMISTIAKRVPRNFTKIGSRTYRRRRKIKLT